MTTEEMRDELATAAFKLYFNGYATGIDRSPEEFARSVWHWVYAFMAERDRLASTRNDWKEGDGG